MAGHSGPFDRIHRGFSVRAAASRATERPSWCKTLPGPGIESLLMSSLPLRAQNCRYSTVRLYTVAPHHLASSHIGIWAGWHSQAQKSRSLPLVPAPHPSVLRPLRVRLSPLIIGLRAEGCRGGQTIWTLVSPYLPPHLATRLLTGGSSPRETLRQPSALSFYFHTDSLFVSFSFTPSPSPNEDCAWSTRPPRHAWSKPHEVCSMLLRALLQVPRHALQDTRLLCHLLFSFVISPSPGSYPAGASRLFRFSLDGLACHQYRTTETPLLFLCAGARYSVLPSLLVS
jgi:hypothetical protein